jgi:hypothetical protein
MIETPQLRQIPFDTIIWGGIGYALGRFAKVDAKLAAAVLIVANIANHILFQSANYCVRPLLEISTEAVYTATNAAISMTTILALRHLNLLSRRVAGSLIFVSIAIVAARLTMLYNNSLPM